ncbi:unnamed protein product [Mycolicibacterium canariasense]|uniref:Uncharacterized protein n=1 Tax=Mycolicibacterium canariasense TaxID=228230 RepID=A0A100WBX1_MYCCR|nr:unnamed protein product [Mycolicibacterium canariasense]
MQAAEPITVVAAMATAAATLASLIAPPNVRLVIGARDGHHVRKGEETKSTHAHIFAHMSIG